MAPHKRLACRVKARPTGASHEHPYVSRCSAHPSFWVSEAKKQNPGAKTRRGNEEVLFEAKAFSWSFRPRRDSGEGRNP